MRRGRARLIPGAPLLAALLLVASRCSSSHAPAAPVAAVEPTAPAPAPAPSVEQPGGPSSEQATGDEIPGPSRPTETVTIKLVADARRQARVFWGRKDLGLAPLEVQRPRGSGPLDLLVVAPGYLPLHTRVFTDKNETFALRLYADKEAAGLVGWTATDPEASTEPATSGGRAARPSGSSVSRGASRR